MHNSSTNTVLNAGSAPNPHDQLREETERTINKLRDFDLRDMVRRDTKQTMDSFMPQWHFNPYMAASLLTAFVCAMVWFSIYFSRFYVTDRAEGLLRWGTEIDSKGGANHKEATSAVKPEMVIVFHHPEFDYRDKDVEISAAALRRALVMNNSAKGCLTRVEAAWQACAQSEASMDRVSRASQRMGLGLPAGHDRAPTCASARVALLQDLFCCLPSWGFDLTVFKSIDGDELHVCVSLQEEEVSRYLLRSSAVLQIQRAIVQQLGISQPPEEPASSPPFLRYDPHVVQKLYRAGVLQSDDPLQLYHTHYGRDAAGSVVSSQDRFRMIYKELCLHIDLDAAREVGLIVDWYPVHSEVWLRNLEATWANWEHLLDMSFAQPVPAIQEYFGSRVAFSFAWNGHYCKALLALVPLMVLVELTQVGAGIWFDRALLRRRFVLSTSILVIIWARIAANLWDREQAFLMQLWELHPGQQELTVRPSFQGELRPSPVDANMQELQYPASKFTSRRLCSALVTILFCLAVAGCIVLWFSVFEGNMGVVASMCLTLQIKVFEAVFCGVVSVLTNWENHKFQSTFYDSHLWKQFLFQSVNNYSAFFYLAVKQRYAEQGCSSAAKCLEVLRWQLIMIQLVLSVSCIAEVILSSLLVKFNLWYERYQCTRANNGIPPPDMSFIETQGKFGEYRLERQIQGMLQLVISLGFVLLFGAVAPIMVPLCLIVFMVHLRATALLLLKYSRRTVPRKQFGIGLWRAVIRILMQVGVLFSAFLQVVYGDTFTGTPITTRLTGAFIYCLSMQVLEATIDLAWPPADADVDVLAARRRHVLGRLAQRCEEAQGGSAPAVDRGPQSRPARLAAAVEDGRWSEIPHGSDGG